MGPKAHVEDNAKIQADRMTAERPLVRSLRQHLLVGIAGGVLLFGGVGAWATNTEFTGAVIAPGQLVVDSSVKKVQHPTGGVVGELKVREGDVVKAGDVVLRLDETLTRASLAIVSKTLDELYARMSRLEAERDGSPTFIIPGEMASRVGEEGLSRVLLGEATLLTTSGPKPVPGSRRSSMNALPNCGRKLKASSGRPRRSRARRS